MNFQQSRKHLANLLLFAVWLLGLDRGQAQFYEKVFDFREAREADAINTGNAPVGDLVQGSDGNFYGTTTGGGANNAGTIFRMTPTGVLTTLVEFKRNGAANEGAYPCAGLVQGGDCNFYGTTTGGANDAGTVFRMTSAGVLTTLVEFTVNGASNKGAVPSGRLVQGSDGNFYRTTSFGGLGAVEDDPYSGYGTVFKMTSTGALTTLVEFTRNGPSKKGAYPSGSLVQGSDGNFYGTTTFGASGTVASDPYSGYGTVFKMTPAGVLTTLVEFTGNGALNKGAGPRGDLVQGSDGSFYGTTADGGINDDGTVFKLTPAGVLTTLVELTADGPSNNGAIPHAGLPEGSDGNFYGTTEEGGASDGGTVFKITSAGVLATLVELDYSGPNKGVNPLGGLVQGGDGNFYGTTQYGGANGLGTVFKMTSAGVLTTLVAFDYLAAIPDVGLVEGSDGNFYGTTNSGFGDPPSFGTVFKMTPAGVLTTLVEFTSDGVSNKGAFPSGRLVQGKDGIFYGATANGGATDAGMVFKMTPAGVLTKLVEFTGNGTSNKGALPNGDLVQGSDGNYYGTTRVGAMGTVPNDSSSGHGTVFRMTPAGILTTLVQFTDNGTSNKGAGPNGGLVQGSDGSFYGTTTVGGANHVGTVFKVTPGGVLTTLVEFTGNGASNKGAYPSGGLVQGSDGKFYGATGPGERTTLALCLQFPRREC